MCRKINYLNLSDQGVYTDCQFYYTHNFAIIVTDTGNLSNCSNQFIYLTSSSTINGLFQKQKNGGLRSTYVFEKTLEFAFT